MQLSASCTSWFLSSLSGASSYRQGRKLLFPACPFFQDWPVGKTPHVETVSCCPRSRLAPCTRAYVCVRVCACVCACVRACVRVCVCVCLNTWRALCSVETFTQAIPHVDLTTLAFGMVMSQFTCPTRLEQPGGAETLTFRYSTAAVSSLQQFRHCVLWWDPSTQQVETGMIRISAVIFPSSKKKRGIRKSWW